MKYRRLGKTGLKVSIVGLGTWQFGGEWGKDFSQKEVDEILETSKEAGINFIDTAECYGDHLSEKLIGQSIKKDRTDWILATKFGHHFHGMMNRTGDYSAKGTIEQLEASLKALQTDYIDLYQFHSGPDDALTNDELWTALDKQVQAGKIKHLGISIGKTFDHEYQIKLSRTLPVETVQLEYNRLTLEPEDRALPLCIEYDLGVLARVPLASGYLSGKYAPGTTFGENDVRIRHNPEDVKRKLEEVEIIKKTEVPEGIDMSQWALSWCLRHPAVTMVIPGCKSPEQVIANAKATELVHLNHPQTAEL
ncbi:aldo/keto reductase [Ammoniphilus sp. CFH 90114]|uniref:aldo/keto reductase n=1 Tax=Ammoniphilus sp. CFH 90114 TaxID=2493665 RepID=UPI00100F09F3|nr:aldo/keto reductase [Ammoniphilus sp. CFH 90114]RXT06513.1 aldo/keto reductase [Ammoniphilus sp. CFH 90114]